MNKKLHLIREKITVILFGIVRCHTKKICLSYQVKAVPAEEEDTIHCIVVDDTAGKKMLNKYINIIQKHKEDYIFITGKVFEQRRTLHNTVLSVRILKASWFERHSDRSTSWLKEKFVYENPQVQPADLAL